MPRRALQLPVGQPKNLKRSSLRGTPRARRRTLKWATALNHRKLPLYKPQSWPWRLCFKLARWQWAGPDKWFLHFPSPHTQHAMSPQCQRANTSALGDTAAINSTYFSALLPPSRPSSSCAFPGGPPPESYGRDCTADLISPNTRTQRSPFGSPQRRDGTAAGRGLSNSTGKS